MRTGREVIKTIKEWASANDLVRAAVLTGSRAVPDGQIDFLSDYDIELFVWEIASFQENDDWIEEFGPIMVRWPYKPKSTFHEDWITRLILFKDKVRIDFQITDRFQVPVDDYDDGYQVLVDKDNILQGLAEPTFSRYKIRMPSPEEYGTIVNEFWWNATYVPKYLFRDELPFAKYMMASIRHEYLHRLIEWYIGMQKGWEVDTGVWGRKFKKFLDIETWQEFELTYAGPQKEENWAAFFNMVGLFRKLARTLGEHLGYNYPHQVDEDVTEYFCWIQAQGK